MIQSEVQIIQAQNAFKRLLAPDPQASVWDVSLIPTEKPSVVDVSISMDNAIQTALGRRPEIDQIRLEIEKLDIDRVYLKKDGKPAIDLVFGITSPRKDALLQSRY